MSAHSASPRRGAFAALAAQVSAFLLEPLEEVVDSEPAELEPYPVLAIVSTAPKSGASTIARMLAAELAVRGDGAALVAGPLAGGRVAPPTRAAARLAIALQGAADCRARGRLCLAAADAADAAPLIHAARYLGPVVIDLPPDGSAAAIVSAVERVALVAAANGEPALSDAVATVLGGGVVKVVNRVTEAGVWEGRADVHVPESKLGARAAALGTRPLGAMGAAIAELADALGMQA